MLADERREFGVFLRGLRTSHDLTLRELAKTSKVPFPNISAIECGCLGAGSIIALKLARGLGLSGSPQKQFLGLAAFTNSRDRLAKEHLPAPRVVRCGHNECVWEAILSHPRSVNRPAARQIADQQSLAFFQQQPG